MNNDTETTLTFDEFRIRMVNKVRRALSFCYASTAFRSLRQCLSVVLPLLFVL